MRIVLTTTLLMAVLGIGLLGINNISAQEGFQTEDLVNETIDLGNATTSNATLAFAQEGAITSGGMNNTMPSGNTSIPGQIVTNATLSN
ncbi:MAG TPA: hypothetical protein VFK40_10590 [Nitrososphaeraceae archaeon]|nr:hypothetical protein [Nitrososphaeraceae archaeon]